MVAFALAAAAVEAANETLASNSTETSLARTPATLATLSPQVIAGQQAFLADISHKFHVLQLIILLGYSVMFLLCVALIAYLRYNRNVAFKGDSTAARKVILPAFEPLLWILCIATGGFATFLTLALACNWFKNTISALATECFYSGRQFVFLMVVLYMLQKSASIPALSRTVAINFVLSTYTIPLQYLLAQTNHADGSASSTYYVGLTLARALLLLLYVYVFIRPPGRASARTIREYCVFAFIYYALLFTYNELFRRARMEEAFLMTYVTISWGALCPLVIWRVLKADTEHWRGMGQRACALQSVFRQKHHINERISSQGLHVLIEMHRKYIIDFAYLQIKQRIGVGASATVFNGVMHPGVPVAIKVYTPSDFTEETVAEFSHEAALCGALNHPNIVKSYGMCVFPPTICLVSELCQGSLDDITRAAARRKHHLNRQQHLIELGFMIDAARAVAYIHSFSPAFLHRDIKPSNFLVDAENNVKLTDFGESRSLAKAQAVRHPSAVGGDSASATSGPHGRSRNDDSVGSVGGGYYSNSPSITLTSGQAKMTVKGTVDYMAPEIIKGRAGQAEYGEAADVYSLAVTMWDILNPGAEKFPTLRNNHLQVFEFVVDGMRPRLEGEATHPGLRQVIESAWHSDPRMRPSAQNIVHILESIQEEMQAVFAQDLMHEFKFDMVAMNNPGDVMPTLFTGEHAVARMEDMNYVNTTAEAVRLGNALMDAGLLHHQKHARGFESSDALYYFDEDNIVLCKPICVGSNPRGLGQVEILGGSDFRHDAAAAASPQHRHVQDNGTPLRPRQCSEHSAFTSLSTADKPRSDQPLLENGMCSCRKLGQRLENPRGARRRYRRKFKAVSEENVLTAKLLAADTSQTTLADFDGFDAVDSNMHA